MIFAGVFFMIKAGYTFTSISNLQKNKEKLTFIWDGRIAKNAITILAAPGDSGKSAVILHLLNKFAGEGWNIVVIDAEGCTEQIISRLDSWDLPHINKVKIAVTKKQYTIDPDSEYRDLETGSTDNFDDMVALIISEKPDLVVIDSLTELSDDLNNPKVISGLQKQFKKIQKKTGAGILIIAHTRKPVAGAKEEVRTAEVSGAGKITTKARAVLMIQKNKETRIIKLTKKNLAGPRPDCSFEFSESTGEVINFKELTPVQEKQYEIEPTTKAGKIRALAEKLLDSGITDWKEIRKIIINTKELKASSKEVKRVHEEFIDQGKIIINTTLC